MNPLRVLVPYRTELKPFAKMEMNDEYSSLQRADPLRFFASVLNQRFPPVLTPKGYSSGSSVSFPSVPRLLP